MCLITIIFSQSNFKEKSICMSLFGNALIDRYREYYIGECQLISSLPGNALRTLARFAQCHSKVQNHHDLIKAHFVR